MRVSLAVALAVLTACGDSADDDPSGGGPSSGGGGAGTGGGGGSNEPLVIARTYDPTDEEFLNPERGFYDIVDLVGAEDMSFVRASGMTLAYGAVHLDAFREDPIDQETLDAVDAGFAAARAAGIKIILRFVYNDGPYPNPEPDASKEQILEHLEQLAPLLEANADVIAVMQAGLVGAWGEWHSSTNGLDNPTDRTDIINAIATALPASRMVQIRTPMFKEEAFGGPLQSGFDGSAAARVGHHNDCFLASDSDLGTYEDPVAEWKAFVAAEGRFVPVGGETCAVNAPRSDCDEATAEMASLHFSYINANYHPDVVDAWTDGECRDDISRELGYRLRMTEASISERVRPGGILDLSVTLENDGYASLFNERPVYVVLEGNGENASALLDVDPRRWEPGAPHDVAVKLRVPADLEPGTYRLALWLPDASPEIAERVEYAVRFANDGVWDDAAGTNVLAEDFTIDADAPGSVDPSAETFAVIE